MNSFLSNRDAFDFVTTSYRDMLYRGLHQTIAEHLSVASQKLLMTVFTSTHQLLAWGRTGLLALVVTGVVMRMIRVEILFSLSIGSP